MNERKRIVIRADGGWRRGFGHLYRMSALNRALTADGYDVRFVAHIDEDALRFLEEQSLAVHRLESPQPYVDMITLSSFAPHVVVLDVLDTNDTGLEYLKRSSAARLVCFDDLGAGLRNADAVINAIVGIWQSDSNQEAEHVFAGPAYLILQEAILSARDSNRSTAPVANNVLIAFGGSDDHDLTAHAIDILEYVEEPLSVAVNLGPGYRDGERIREKATASRHNINVINKTPSLISLIGNCDILMCAGGVMAFEAAALGTPILGFAAAAHEAKTLEYLELEGTGRHLGLMNEVAAATEVLSVIGDPATRRSMSEAGRRLVDGLGLRRCIDIVEGLTRACA